MDEAIRLKYFPRKERAELLTEIAGDYKRQIITNQISNRSLNRAVAANQLVLEGKDKKMNDRDRRHVQRRIDEMIKQIDQNNSTIVHSYEMLRIMGDFQLEIVGEEASEIEANEKAEKKVKIKKIDIVEKTE